MKSTELDLKNSRDKESLDGLMKEVESGWKNSQLGLLKKERSKSCQAFLSFFISVQKEKIALAIHVNCSIETAEVCRSLYREDVRDQGSLEVRYLARRDD